MLLQILVTNKHELMNKKTCIMHLELKTKCSSQDKRLYVGICILYLMLIVLFTEKAFAVLTGTF